jgi:hypothetical protein
MVTEISRDCSVFTYRVKQPETTTLYHSVRFDIPENLHLYLTFSYSSLPDWASRLSLFSTDSDSPSSADPPQHLYQKQRQLNGLRHRRQHDRTLSVRYFSPPHNVHPITRHERPEVKQKYSCTLSITSALDESGWSTPRPGSFISGKDPVPIV